MGSSYRPELGQPFGWGTVIDPEVWVIRPPWPSNPRGARARGARLHCECGNEYSVIWSALSRTHSCGCWYATTRLDGAKARTEKRQASLGPALPPGFKYCTQCRNPRHLDEFGPDPRSGDSKQYACKHCYVDYQTNSGQRGAYRARKAAAQVAGPVPPGTYTKVRTSAPCVYCGAPATTVDHVTPLARGGDEAEYNLVPACNPCNSSKNAKLLTEWDPVRVAHAAACSDKVAAQLDLQLAA